MNDQDQHDGTAAGRKSVSDIFREHGHPPMTDERRAAVETKRIEGLARAAARKVRVRHRVTESRTQDYPK